MRISAVTHMLASALTTLGRVQGELRNKQTQVAATRDASPSLDRRPNQNAVDQLEYETIKTSNKISAAIVRASFDITI